MLFFWRCADFFVALAAMGCLVAAMKSLTLIRKPGPGGIALAIALWVAGSDLSFAALGSKPLQGQFASRPPNRVRKVSRSSEKPVHFAASSAKSRPSSASPLHRLGQMIRTVRTTAYTHEESGHQAYGRSTAIGTTLRCSRSYTSAAADWSRFPLGTKFQIVGEPTVYVIDDCGGALYGTDTIDIYRPSLASMNAWGTRHVQIKILETGQRSKSRRS